MFFYLQPETARLADINKHLIDFYKHVRTNLNELFTELNQISTEFDALLPDERKLYYLNLRKEFNESSKSVRHSACFYALNKLCFNGLYRENAKGAFNVPFGQKASFPKLNLDNFQQVSEAFSRTGFFLGDFEEALATAVAGDFAYLDPPYIPLDATPSFTSYSADGFGLEEQKRLAETMSLLKEKGVKVVLSNSATDLTREVYKDFHIIEIHAPRMVSAKASGRGQIKEFLIFNFS